MNLRRSWFKGEVRESGPATASNGSLASTGIIFGNVYVGAAPGGAAAARERLARLVTRQWKDEAIYRSLDNPESMPVCWHPARDRKLVTASRNLVESSRNLMFTSDDLTPLVTAFRDMGRRRLVIIGKAGSGKTTLAVQLVRDLLKTRTDHPDEPVPVLLSAANWDPAKFRTLREWVAYRLAQDYKALGARVYGPNAHRELVDGAYPAGARRPGRTASTHLGQSPRQPERLL